MSIFFYWNESLPTNKSKRVVRTGLEHTKMRGGGKITTEGHHAVVEYDSLRQKLSFDFLTSVTTIGFFPKGIKRGH